MRSWATDTVGVTEDTPVGYREFHFQKRLAAAGKV